MIDRERERVCVCGAVLPICIHDVTTTYYLDQAADDAHTHTRTHKKLHKSRCIHPPRSIPLPHHSISSFLFSRQPMATRTYSRRATSFVAEMEALDSTSPSHSNSSPGHSSPPAMGSQSSSDRRVVEQQRAAANATSSFDFGDDDVNSKKRRALVGALLAAWSLDFFF